MKLFFMRFLRKRKRRDRRTSDNKPMAGRFPIVASAPIEADFRTASGNVCGAAPLQQRVPQARDFHRVRGVDEMRRTRKKWSGEVTEQRCARPRARGLREIASGDSEVAEAIGREEPSPEIEPVSVGDVDADLLYQPGRQQPLGGATQEARDRQG